MFGKKKIHRSAAKNTEVGRQLPIFSHYNGIPVVSSRTVHEVFNKRHDNVLADIRNLIEKVEQSEKRTGGFNALKFEEIDFIKSTYLDSKNREYPEYLLTRDFFTYIATGYRGEEAAESKIAYIRQGSGNE